MLSLEYRNAELVNVGRLSRRRRFAGSYPHPPVQHLIERILNQFGDKATMTGSRIFAGTQQDHRGSLGEQVSRSMNGERGVLCKLNALFLVSIVHVAKALIPE